METIHPPPLISQPTPLAMGTPLPDLNSICRSILLFLFFFIHSSSSSPQTPYSPRCGHIVPESTRSDDPYIRPPRFLHLFNAYVANAHQLIGSPSSQITAHFRIPQVYPTHTPGIIEIEGVLRLRVSRIWGFSGNSTARRLYRVYGGPRGFRSGRLGLAVFNLRGFWSSSSGQLCTVGSGWAKPSNSGKNLNFTVVFQLNYQNTSSIVSSLVTGRLESLDSEGTDGYFTPISVLDFSRMNYDYSLIKDEIGSNYVVKSTGPSKYDLTGDCFNLGSLSQKFKLEFGGSCGGRNCTLPDRSFGFSPKFMSMNIIDCSIDQFVRFSFGFSNASIISNGFLQPFEPGSALVAEGVWNQNRTEVRFVACRISVTSSGNASVGDCSIRLNFKIASVLSIRWRSLIDGQMRSNKSVDDVSYFDPVEIRTSEPKRLALPEMRYEYSEIERANRYCSENKAAKKKGKNYPSPFSFDMKFDMAVRNGKKQNALGTAIPMFVNGYSVLNAYGSSPLRTTKHLGALSNGGLVNHTNGYLANISYSVTFKPMFEFKLGGESFSKKLIDISAEGTYDTETGLLCMVGCWARDTDVDCEIFIRVQFSDGSNGMAKGTIESKRKTTDPLYFEQLSLTATSITEQQADKSIWRMDLELAMVLVSNTLACVFLGLQLLHVKNRPEVLPFISVVMLVVLTLGHMVPLLLNFDALLSNHELQNILPDGDWLEINEITVRAITMIAFLLEARLLQLAWSSRTANENRNTLWAAEKKVVYLSLPMLCLFGALIAWFVHPWKSIRRTRFSRLHSLGNPHWRGLKAFAGLVLDAFLFPQIIFNVFCDARENSLALPYYVGTTIVRLLPHVYDLFRAHSFALKLDLWSIYANPRMNFYSTSWDIIICCCGLLFAAVIYLQQRFGGCCVIPSRLRERYVYEKVPVAVADSK